MGVVVGVVMGAVVVGAPRERGLEKNPLDFCFALTLGNSGVLLQQVVQCLFKFHRYVTRAHAEFQGGEEVSLRHAQWGGQMEQRERTCVYAAADGCGSTARL
jgi:hypothetical protein